MCRPRVDHYFPDLHHLKFEIEEGTTLDGRPVRFGYNPLEFADFSWRGYAQLSPIQVGLHLTIYPRQISNTDVVYINSVCNSVNMETVYFIHPGVSFLLF